MKWFSIQSLLTFPSLKAWLEWTCTNPVSLHLHISITCWLLELTLSIFHIHFSVTLVSPLGYLILLSQEKEGCAPISIPHILTAALSSHQPHSLTWQLLQFYLITIKAVVEGQRSIQMLEKHHSLVF